MNLKISKTSSRPTRADAHANATAEILSWATSDAHWAECSADQNGADALDATGDQQVVGQMTRLDMREPDQLMVPIAHAHYRRGRSCL
jgi:hypothetical protein